MSREGIASGTLFYKVRGTSVGPPIAADLKNRSALPGGRAKLWSAAACSEPYTDLGAVAGAALPPCLAERLRLSGLRPLFLGCSARLRLAWSFYISSDEVGRTGKSAGATRGTATLGCSPKRISRLRRSLNPRIGTRFRFERPGKAEPFRKTGRQSRSPKVCAAPVCRQMRLRTKIRVRFRACCRFPCRELTRGISNVCTIPRQQAGWRQSGSK